MKTRTLIMLAICALSLTGCSAQRKLSLIRNESLTARLALPSGSAVPKADTVRHVYKDTLQYTDFDGHQVIIMNAVRDEDGDMVAHDVIDAAVVTARFRNVAERHGKVDLEFQVTVPSEMRDSRWQLRLHPEMRFLSDTLTLDDVVITGSGYRKAQLRGYQQYRKFLDTIIADTTVFINQRQLELFIQRNIPALYAFRTDSSFVTDSQFASVYGVTEQQAVRHYTALAAKRRNERRRSRRDEMFRRYVRIPIITEGIRLDTVIVNPEGDFTYNYIQTIATRPGLRKAEVVLPGDIYEQDKHIYTIPEGEPLTFYISSLSAFVDGTERYLTRIVERRAEASTACYIDFGAGCSEIDASLGNNPGEIGRIRENLRQLTTDGQFDLDSIVITAYASPEGAVGANDALCLRRARSASDYFNSCLDEIRDSLRREEGIHITYDGAGRETVSEMEKDAPIRFISRSGGENWEMLRRLVDEDAVLSPGWKQSFLEESRSASDLDAFERSLFRSQEYRHLRQHVYPRLRVVEFAFHLHRKGMVKDTVHTTVPDTVYAAGVQAIRDRDYEKAVTLLRPYGDYNTAIAYCALDYNASALSILEHLEKTPQVNYMLSVLYSRKGEDELAVKHYLRSCEQEPGYIHRGNLDPEISALIRRYGLNAQENPEEDYNSEL